MLVTVQRYQSVYLMDIRHMVKGKSSYKFDIDKLVKQSRPGKPKPVLVLPAYPEDKRLGVISYLQEYLTRTESVRSSEHTSLFLNYSKPHHPVCKRTISRWFIFSSMAYLQPHLLQLLCLDRESRQPLNSAYYWMVLPVYSQIQPGE